ncbi:molybdate transport system substrate-binding protein [Noviherbaspirillum humi]|uniref:Molybdate transport system substrate-binding protein n=1 Tax=Noviherbaspirillum humi TaxID=1688639 RepID=A0A239M096_9BURK|nr:molybdate ABC transporter substrate-binding protein [Noviherbaspirillum humi]SNT35329.1 molybdate transport system substrate-binding protein [Noviherbaspirillum humi]
MIRLKFLHTARNVLALSFLASSLAFSPAQAQTNGEIKVMISGGFSAAYDELVPQFEARHGVKVTTVHGPSMGATPQAIPNRLARGESADVVILADTSLDKLIEQGKVLPASRTDLVRSIIAMAVKEGAPVPKLETTDDLKKAMLEAKSIAYSDSASGVYIATEMLKKLGIEEQVKGKSRAIPAEPVAKVVARGEAEIGFQQMSELKPIKGITIVGPIPAEVQKVTVFSAGVVKGAPNEQGGMELVRYLSSEAAEPAIVRSGLEPAWKGK